MAVEGPILDRSGLTPRVARHTTPEIAKVDLARDANSSMWLAIATNSDGEVVTLTDYDRLTLSRTFAKVGDIALRKLNKK
jgi:predicted nucleic acid-binding protein